MKKVIAFLLVVFGGWPLVGRGQTVVGDTGRVYRSQPGVLAMPQARKGFARNPVLPVGFIYKRQVTANSALRVTDRYR